MSGVWCSSTAPKPPSVACSSTITATASTPAASAVCRCFGRMQNSTRARAGRASSVPTTNRTSAVCAIPAMEWSASRRSAPAAAATSVMCFRTDRHRPVSAIASTPSPCLSRMRGRHCRTSCSAVRPRVCRTSAEARARRGVAMGLTLIDQRRRSLGAFEVGRVLPHAHRHMVGPFIFFDHLGPVELPKGLAREADVRPHPHIGLSTVTYLFAGEIMHRDSTAVQQAIRPGEVNWMTAGRGITHSERFERARREGGPIHAIQSWVALPDGEEETTPHFAHHAGDDLPTHRDGGMWLRLLAGEAFGLRAAVRIHSPLFYLHVTLEPGTRMALPREYPERAAYLV